ncbi:endonuclease/exonuclease/phosphatase family protein [Micromonospora phytophila]|uniref:endonuclease/exonuclease/phosphatase family protein n=1 Tax=Micromonospora phytophila TaxID=709888 RepID=UPI00202EE8C8|nr:endonuclease/exonuclease/phosphatase family protein [Micromonospora phytophila]MCM0673434.1 endonuclease/exonuclease/phosphatase family protein [Micromonospora phytophila]
MAVVLLVSALALTSGSSVAGTAASTPWRVLQMNLCNSGLAGCYTGRSVTRAAEVIRAETPDLVTLNEVCQDDVSPLERTLAEVRGGGTVVSAFKAAGDRRTGGAFRCRNGHPYGIALLAYVPDPYRGHAVHGGIYPAQDLTDPEERAWLCVSVTSVLHACTTHLAATSPSVALAQCGHLLGAAIPAMRVTAGHQPVVLSGDLNLRQGGSPDVRSCLAPGYLRADDGAVQHVVATTDFTVRSRRSIGMGTATDHPSFLVTLTLPLNQHRSPEGDRRF